MALVALDFDGVVHQYVSPWTTPEEVRDPPMPGAFEFMTRLLDAGYEVAIVSSRMRTIEGRAAVMSWFIEHGFARIADLSWPDHKPPSIMTIDDRGYSFRGVWPTLQEVKDFKPWKLGRAPGELNPEPSG